MAAFFEGSPGDDTAPVGQVVDVLDLDTDIRAGLHRPQFGARTKDVDLR